MLEIVETGTNHNCSSSNLFYFFFQRSICKTKLSELVCATDGAPSPACQGGPTGRCTRLSALGCGTVVPADQSGAQTYIKRGKGSRGMKGISTSPEQVAVWVNSFSACAHLNIAIEHMYNEAGEEQTPHGEVDGEAKNEHNEEGEGRRRLDEADRKKITVELENYSHPLNYQQPGVYNICNGHVAPGTVNVQNALAIGSEQSRQFSASLSSEFHKKVKTMELLKKAITVKGKATYDVVTLFSLLLVVGQQRSIDIADVFQFELSPVPPALIDEYGC